MANRRPARTAASFRRWLLAQPAGAVVGQRCSAEFCPISLWLSDGTGGDVTWVGDVLWRSGIDDPLRPMPRWARRFVEMIDLNPLRGRESAVLVDEANAAMARVLAEGHRS